MGADRINAVIPIFGQAVGVQRLAFFPKKKF
jgi:hypothetical protein